MNPRISVIIPLYNKAPHIQKTLESVLSQSLLPYEIIVVDDGSLDGGSEIVSGMENPCLVLLTQENQGVSAARNAGVKIAQGDYVAFLDADDCWKPFHIEELSSLIKEHPEASLFSSMHSFLLSGVHYFPSSPFSVGATGKVDDFFRIYANHLAMIIPSTACVLRESMIAIDGFPLGVKRGEDVIVWIKLALHYGVAHSSRVTAVYNRDAINRVADMPDNDAPTSLSYLSEMLCNTQMDSSTYSGAALLFSKIAFNTCAHRRYLGQWIGMSDIFRLALKVNMWGLSTKIAILFLMPRPLINFAKHLKYRNKVRDQ